MSSCPQVLIVGADTFRARAYATAIEWAGLGPIQGLFYGAETPRHRERDHRTTLGDLWLPQIDISVFEVFERNGWPYQRLTTDRISAPECVAALRESRAALAIFAGRGGEIVSAEALGQGVPMLHMHPGNLPSQRGSTTIYYSILERRPCSVSALLMSTEIDAGPVLAIKEYPVPPGDMDIDVLYDCAIRADTLIDVLRRWRSNGQLPRASASGGKGTLYFVVHPVLKHLALLSLAPKTQR